MRSGGEVRAEAAETDARISLHDRDRDRERILGVQRVEDAGAAQRRVAFDEETMLNLEPEHGGRAEGHFLPAVLDRATVFWSQVFVRRFRGFDVRPRRKEVEATPLVPGVGGGERPGGRCAG